jgi:hypothetical protein
MLAETPASNKYTIDENNSKEKGITIKEKTQYPPNCKKYNNFRLFTQ